MICSKEADTTKGKREVTLFIKNYYIYMEIYDTKVKILLKASELILRRKETMILGQANPSDRSYR